MNEAVVAYLANGLWQIPLAALGAWAVSRCGALGPRGRHRVWSAALAAAAILPALPGLPLARLFEGPPPDPAALPAFTPAMIAALPPPAAPGMALSGGLASLIVVAFAAAVSLGALRIVLAVLAAARLARLSRPLTLAPAVTAPIDAFAIAHGRGRPAVRLCGAIAGPVVVGVRAPAILVPAGFAALPEDEQRAALLHELAHVMRRDYAANLAAEVLSLPISWHPAAWALKAGLRQSREVACDALAAGALGPTDAYARRLVALARAFGDTPVRSPALVGLIGKSNLEKRLMHLLTPAPAASPRRRLAAALLAGALLAPALILRVSPAIAQPAAPPAVPAPAAAAALPAAPAVAAAPARPAPRHVRIRSATPVRLAQLDQVPADEPPPPPPPPAPPPAPPLPPAPPAPPSPPVPPSPPTPGADELRALAAQGRWDELAQRAVERAEKAAEGAAMRQAMAQMRAGHALTEADRARMHADIAAAMAELRNSHLKETLAQLKAELDGPEFRAAIRDAARAAAESARAQAEAERSDKR